jgi:hypothetical protein
VTLMFESPSESVGGRRRQHSRPPQQQLSFHPLCVL